MKYLLSFLSMLLAATSFCQVKKDTTVFVLPGTIKDTVLYVRTPVITQRTVTTTYADTNWTTVVIYKPYKPPVTPPPANKPPVSNAGADKIITLPLNTVIVTGEGSTDQDGVIIAFGWTRISGPGSPVIAAPKNVLTNITGLAQGIHVFRLVVSDNNNATATDDVTVTVNAEPVIISKPPVADGGVNVILTTPANYIILRGKATPAAGKTITSYTWSNVSGPANFTIDNPSSADCGFGSLVQGIYIFRLTATDNTGLTGTDDVTVTVNAGVVIPPPPPPVDTTQPPTGSVKYLQLPIGKGTTYNGASNIVIQNQQFSNVNDVLKQNGNIFRFFNCTNVTFRNCFFGEASGGDLGGDRAIYFNGCSNIIVENCLFSDQGGAVLVSSHGNGMVIRNNEFMNVRGPYPKGNFIQLNTCNGSGYLIEKNKGENFYSESYPEDIISMYATSGTVASPIIVQDNLWRGGGSSTTGGGGTFGDHGGSNIVYQRNKLYNPGQYGLGVGGGNNHKVLNNWIWQEQKPWSANGIVAFAYSPPCTNVTIQGNMVHAVCGLPIRCTPGVLNNYYLPAECTFIGDPRAGVIDFTNVALMNFPSKLITFISEDEIWQLRHATKKHEALMISTAMASPQNWTAQSISRPTASATYSSGTLRSTSVASAGNNISVYRWVKVSGPGTITFASPNAAVTTITTSAPGTYTVRLEVTQFNNVALNVITQDAIWVTFTITSAGFKKYYISNDGNDLADGSINNPWKTLSKIMSNPPAAGDSVFLKRGDMWREQLTIPSSGSAGNPITFAAYGSGAKPIINAANIISVWTNTSANVWSASLTPTYAMIIIGGVIFKEEANLLSVNAASEYFISGGKVYVYSTVNPSTLGAEISMRQFGVYVTKHHINVINLDCRYAYGGGIMFDGSIDGQCIVDSCYAYANRLWGVVSRGGHNNNVFKNSSADYNGNGFYAWDGSDGITMQKCSTAHSIHYKAISQFTDGGAFQNYRGDNFLVEYCYSIDDYDSFHPDAGGRSIHATFRYNKAFNSRFGSGDPNTPTAGFGSLGAGGVIEFYYNLFVNGASSGIECYSTNNGTVRIYNNTFYEDATHATDAIMYLANGLNIDVKNNIFVRDFVLGEYTLANFGTPAITSNNNCWYMYGFTPGNGPIRHFYQNANYFTLTTWNTATGRDANSISVDPLFINKTSDWKLQASSPCINAGVSVGLTKDIDGKPVIGLPDIGAHELM